MEPSLRTSQTSLSSLFLTLQTVSSGPNPWCPQPVKSTHTSCPREQFPLWPDSPTIFIIPFLAVFSVDRNNLSGSFPSNNFSVSANMKFFSIRRNQLTGKIPASFAQCRDLQSLFLGANEFTGDIPAELENLRELKDLGLARNKLSGLIPSSLGNLTKLRVLILDYIPSLAQFPPPYSACPF